MVGFKGGLVTFAVSGEPGSTTPEDAEALAKLIVSAAAEARAQRERDTVETERVGREM